MSRFGNLKDLFKRYRRPGDLVFAVFFFAFSVFLMVNLPGQTTWVERTKLFAQPAFWPTVSIISMTLFAFLHWVGSVLSPRIEGRWQEVGFWFRSIEYAFWFLGYVMLVPVLGYLPSTMLFTVLLALRLGYRGGRPIVAAAGVAIFIVVVFKSLLHVKVPGGQVYQLLPDGLRAFMLTYF